MSMKNHHAKRFSLQGKNVFYIFSLLFSFPFVSADTPFSSAQIFPSGLMIFVSVIFLFLLVGLGANIPFFSIVGFVGVCAVGVLLYSGSVMLPTGESNESFVYNGSNISIVSSSVVYTAWVHPNARWLGIFVFFAGAMASVFSVFAVFGGRS